MDTQLPAFGTETWLPNRIRERWSEVRIVRMRVVYGRRRSDDHDRGSARVRVRVRLGSIAPEEVVVELTVGSVLVASDPSAAAIRLANDGRGSHGSFTFEAELPRALLDGSLGFTIRVVPDQQRRPVAVPAVMRALYHGRALPPSEHRRVRRRYGWVSAARRNGDRTRASHVGR